MNPIIIYKKEMPPNKFLEESHVSISKSFSIKDEGKFKETECEKIFPSILKWDAKKIFLGFFFSDSA